MKEKDSYVINNLYDNNDIKSTLNGAFMGRLFLLMILLLHELPEPFHKVVM